MLAGIVLGLKAQGMPASRRPAPRSGCMAPRPQRVGAGLIAEDVIDALPGVLDRSLAAVSRRAPAFCLSSRKNPVL